MLARLFDNLRRRGVITVMAPYTVGAWLLMQVMSVLQPALAFEQWVTTLVTVVLITGFPIAFYVAWFFEFTDNGIKRTTLEDEASLESLTSSHWAGLGLTSAAAIGIGYFFFQVVSTNLSKEAEGIEELALEQSIAVLPFKDQSADQDQRFFAEGIADELTGLLGRMPGLKVASASSTFRLMDRDMDPVAIGRRLDVATLLGGSIRVAGDQMKVRVELINVEDGKVLWTQNFSRKLLDIFAVEEEIARSIVNLLQDRYLEKGGVTLASKTANTDAYVLYLKGEEEFRKRTTGSMRAARKFYEEAVGLDPEYAAAHVGVAKTVLLLAKGRENLGNLDRQVAATLAEQTLAKALVRAPDLAAAYASQGRVHALRNEHDEAVSAYDKAIGLNPNLADAWLWKALAFSAQQKRNETFEFLLQAYDLDPISLPVLHNLGFILTNRGELAEAKQMFDELVEFFPESPLGHRGLANLAWREGSFADSLAEWKLALELSPEDLDIQFSYIGLLMSLGLVEQVKPLATDPFWAANILLLEGRYEELHAKMDFDVQAWPDDPWITFEAGWYQFLVGDVQKGATLIVKANQNLSEGERFTMPFCSPGIEIAYAYQVLGDSDHADEYMSKCEAKLELARSSGFEDSRNDHLAARLAAIQGKTALAADELNRAFENGMREWWVDLDPLLSTEQDNPEIVSTFAKVKSALAVERRIALLQLGQSDTE